MLKKQEQMNRQELNNDLDRIKIAKDNIYKQAGMAGLAIVVTMVLVFAMTVAWYSNVIHTEGLVFQASSWNFDFSGEIEVGSETQLAAPGDSGIVSLKLENTSDDAITVLVNVTKNTENFGEMQKRIYFYVDTAKEINGETVERVYVNETEEYGYTILPANTLTLNEDYHSDPYLKWEWVYDVLGYYVTGTMDGTTLTVEDYMRPVIYDYEQAIFDDEGELVSVDGGVSREDFLKKLYESDGYEGKEVKEAVNGYYPIVVDEESNYGIWLYLCNEGEIEASTLEDTAMAEDAANDKAKEFAARLLLSGQQKKEAQMQVADASELATQLNASDIDKVTMSGNITMSDTITVADAKDVVLDLNNNVLTLPSSGTGITVEEGGSLTIMNGTIEGAGTRAITATGSNVTLSNVVYSGGETAVYIADDSATGIDSRVKITNSSITTDDVSVMIRGNGDTSSRKTTLLIENSTIISNDYIALMGNGSANGTDVEIIGSTLEGYWAGIYQPQKDSTLTVMNSTIKGYTGMAIKAGTVLVDNSTIQGTGEKQEAAFAKSGYTDTGDAIYIETNYETDISLTVQGKNTLVKSTNSLAIQVYEPDAPQVSVTVTGGKFSSDVIDFVPVGYAILEEADNTYIVDQEAASAE